MTDPVARAGAAPRLLRAAVFTAVCVVLSATGHVLAACAPVPWWSLLLGLLGMFAVAVPLAGRPRSALAVAAGLTGGQAALHTLFGLGQQRMAMPMTVGVHHHRMNMGPAPAPGSSDLAAAGMLPSLPMVLGHLLAALATGWLLHRGDLALVRLVRLSAHGIGEITDSAQLRALRAALTLVRALLGGLPGVPAPDRRAPRTSYGPPPASAGKTLQHTVIRRGPPAAHALAA
ncbi:hypothetical protein [Streptomyces sp. NPDC088725]|uniref:hypothetical protein n=1 Tax=Streptomyces sp. NPDC088725 TaxID=3365873 RepID=UPI0038125A5D